MMVYMPENGLFLNAIEGTGDIFLLDDREEGYVDYVYITVYEWDGDELVEFDGGMMMLTELFDDKYGNDNRSLIKDSMEFMDYNVSDYVEIKEA